MRWLRLLFRIFGWLLTPFLAWAASFFGAVGGALIAMRMIACDSPQYSAHCPL